MDDWQLLQNYVERDSETAFRTLVNRYVNLVYSVAVRYVRDAQLAEEVAQAVFILLARKARGFRPGVMLSGWLFRTTRFVASRAVRAEQRRQRGRGEETGDTRAGETAQLLCWTGNHLVGRAAGFGGGSPRGQGGDAAGHDERHGENHRRRSSRRRRVAATRESDVKRVALGEVTNCRRGRDLDCRGNATDSLGDHSISGRAPVRKGRRSRGCADRCCGDRGHTKRARPGGFSFDEFGGAEQVDLSCVGRANGYGRGGRNRRCELRLRGEMVGGGRPCFRLSRDVQHPDSRR